MKDFIEVRDSLNMHILIRKDFILTVRQDANDLAVITLKENHGEIKVLTTYPQVKALIANSQ